MSDTPILIAAAPNGARKTKADHPQLPLTNRELIDTAVSCAEAGAGMMHFHIRDKEGRHSLEPEPYRKILAELEAAVGDRLLLQVTSEAAGIYNQQEQIDLMKRLAPHCLSCALKEFIRSDADLDSGAAFFQELHRAGTLLQYILYTPSEVALFADLCSRGVLPGSSHFLLFVFGRYLDHDADQVASLDDYLEPLQHHATPFTWMVCGFGGQEFSVAEAAAARGGHIRVGFENNCCRPDGSPAVDNSSQVRDMGLLAAKYGRSAQGKHFAESLYR